MTSDTILFTKNGKTAYLTLNRPEAMNRLDLGMAYQIESACRAIVDDDEIQVLLITGSGDAFCAGEELDQLLAENPDSLTQSPGAIAINALSSLTVPIVAAIGGAAHGAGLELALACDIRIASENASFLAPELSAGYMPHCGGTQRLPRIAGKGRALEMLLVGEEVSAREAFDMGLVSKVVRPEELPSEAQAMAQKLAQKAPIALRYAREAVNKGMDLTLEQGMRLEGDLYFLLQTTQDRMEGIRSFLEKRTPKFEGR